MPDKRSVDDLSIEELERVLAIKKRQARQDRLNKMQNSGRVVPAPTPESRPAQPIAPQAGVYFDDELTMPPAKRKPNNTEAWRKFLDRMLLLLEGVAVVGLVVVGAVMLLNITTLQEETDKAQREAQELLRAGIPTIAPTPTLNLAQVVLPGGHTPPTAPNGGQFNFEEIPSNLRAQLMNQIFLPPEIARPPVLPETPIRVVIPDLNIDQSIVQGVDWEALKLGVGMLPNNATPVDRDANIVLAAHNDIYGQIFKDLDQLKVGMYFQIHTQTQIYTYVVTGMDIVKPSAVYVMDNRGYAAATLISCYPYQVNTERYIVFAERVDT